jgi:membrane protein
MVTEYSAHPRSSGTHQEGTILRETFRNWDTDNVSRMAAALSCYTLLSIAPLGILLMAIAGVVFSRQAASGQIAIALGPVLGAEIARAIESVIANARTSGTGFLSTAMGLVVLLLGASGVFVELQAALNTIWKVQPKPGHGALLYIRHRFLSFAMVLAIAGLLLISLLMNAALAAVGTYFEQYLPGGEPIWQTANGLGWFALTAALFAVVFRVVPEIEIAWKSVWIGAVVTAFLFTLGKLLLGLYLGKSSFASSYGAAGSVVAIVAWVYYSCQAILLGAEFTAVYARRNVSAS